MSNAVINRPFKFGAKDRREFIVQDSEVALRAINDVNGNPIFLGRAKIGTLESVAKWQIRKLAYDSSEGVTSVLWPENSLANASSDYEYLWTIDTDLTITGISKANPAIVTVSSIGDLINGDLIVIQDVAGMTEVNFDGDNIYTVANIAGATFELSGINSSAFTTYTSGGKVVFGAVVNHTYS